ncbi:CPCC family cysteine-rich protein [Intrasporangium mesophilum]
MARLGTSWIQEPASSVSRDLAELSRTMCRATPFRVSDDNRDDDSRMMAALLPCPCCGHTVLSAERPGSSLICPICRWEDDLLQLRWPRLPGGANGPCLVEAQQAYRILGAKEARATKRARPPSADEQVDIGFRPIQDSNNFEDNDDVSTLWPKDLTQLYWWRPNFWRRGRA